MAAPPGESELLRRVADGDRDAFASLCQTHFDRLRRMVCVRLDRRLRSRVEPDALVQSVCVEMVKRAGEYLEDPKRSFYVWVRGIALQILSEVHGQFLGSQASRGIPGELSLHPGPLPLASSVSLAEQLLGDTTSPIEASFRSERHGILEKALNSLEALDREVLALRHLEELSNDEIAEVLGVSEAAASERYVRALTRIASALPPEILGRPDR